MPPRLQESLPGGWRLHGAGPDLLHVHRRMTKTVFFMLFPLSPRFHQKSKSFTTRLSMPNRAESLVFSPVT